MSPHSVPSLHDLEHGLPFVDRHVGPRPDELATMLATVGVASLDELADRALPASIRDRGRRGRRGAAGARHGGRGRSRSCARSPPATT